MNCFRIQQKYFGLSFFFLLAMIGLTGCIDLSGSRSVYTKQSGQQPTYDSNKEVKVEKGEVHTMRGGLGIFSIGMNQLRDSSEARFNIPAYSTMWYNAGDVSRTIISNYYKQKIHKPIILIGHSLGANEQIKVARNLNAAGVPVDLLVTVDAVSQTIVPPNVKEALNVYKPGFVPMFSGLRLRAVNPNATHIENINVNTLKGVTVNHFTIDKDRVVQALILDKVKKVLINGNRKGT
jgi:hypothetical protein